MRKKILKFAIISIIILGWVFGYPPVYENFWRARIWQNPPIPPEVLTTKAASPEAFAYTGSTQYFYPANGIYAVTVECWGGGGGGGVINNQGGGGGGGGAYAKSTNVSVAPGSSYDVVIGNGGTAELVGGNSTFGGTTVVAVGGGAAANATAGAGGLASNSTWNAIGSNGGTGGTGESVGTYDAGGGGGGAGGPNGAGLTGANGQGITLGGNGGDSNQGTGVGDGGLGQQGNVGLPGGQDLTYGGGGGGGGDDQYNGGAGGTPGGGGGGAGDDATVATGADGRCIVSYTDTWAPSISQASYDNTWTFATAPDNDAGGQISMDATPGYDYNTISYSFTFTACASNGGTGGTSSGWQSADTTYTDTGLDPNKCYGYTVQTKDSLENTGTASAASETYSSANVPGQPTLGSATATTLTLTNDANGNPAADPITLFAVKVVTGDAGWVDNWVNSAGEPVGSEDWLRDDQLDGLILGSGGTPLTAGTTYGVQVKAKNENGGITDLGLEGQGITSAAAATLTLTLDSGDPTSLGTVNSGTPVTATTRLKVDTNNAAGYLITAGRNNLVNSDALFSAFGNLTIDDSGIPTHTTACDTPLAWAAASTGLGFTVYDASGGGKNTSCWGNSTAETGANLYASLAASASATTILNESDNSPNPSYVSIGYKLDVTAAQIATTYNDGQVVFTATTN